MVGLKFRDSIFAEQVLANAKVWHKSGLPVGCFTRAKIQVNTTPESGIELRQA